MPFIFSVKAAAGALRCIKPNTDLSVQKYSHGELAKSGSLALLSKPAAQMHRR